MQKDMQKRLIMLLVTAAFVMTIMGASSASTDPTSLSLSVNDTAVEVGESVLLTSRLTRAGTSNGINGQTIHFFVDGVEIGTNTTQGSGGSTGTARFTYTPTTTGVKQIQARFYGVPDPPGPTDGWLPSNSVNRTVTVTAPAAPELGITKYPDRNPANYNVGENVVFTIYTQNVGTATANNVVITDTIPNGFSIVDAAGGTVVGNTITWNIGNLAAGADNTILLTLGVLDGYQGQTLTNSVSAGCAQTGTVTNTSSIYVNNSVLTVDKYPDRNPANYNVGENVVYTITVRNTGPDAATGVVISDPFIAGLFYLDLDGGTVVGNTIIWNIGNLAVNGQVTVQVTARVNAGTQGQTLTNTVSAYNNQNPTPVTDTADIYIENPVLEITKDTDRNPANYNVGENVVYTITVRNTGPGTAEGTVVTDTLPAGLNFVSASDSYVWDANTRTITWNLYNLSPGGTFTPTVTATVTSEAAGKTLVNTATVDSDQLEAPLTTTASIYVPSADLVLTKTVDKATPTVKDTVVFTLIVNNNGPDTAVDVTVNDKLPAGLTYVSHVANFGTYDPATGLWSIASLPNGASAVLTITAVVEESGQIVNQANVTALTWDPNLEGNTASAAMDVQEQPGPGPEPKPVHGKTVDMEKTGAPIGALLVAFFMLLAGMVLPRRK